MGAPTVDIFAMFTGFCPSIAPVFCWMLKVDQLNTETGELVRMLLIESFKGVVSVSVCWHFIYTENWSDNSFDMIVLVKSLRLCVFFSLSCYTITTHFKYSQITNIVHQWCPRPRNNWTWNEERDVRDSLITKKLTLLCFEDNLVLHPMYVISVRGYSQINCEK